MKRSSKNKLAKRLQNNPTASERVLRRVLTKLGYKFQFQEILYGYIPDFYFPNEKKIVELDGEWCHDKEYDARRDGHLLEWGIETYRIPSALVFKNMDRVKLLIKMFLETPNKAVSTRTEKPRKRSKWLAKLPSLRPITVIKKSGG